MLTNSGYLGFIKYKGELFEGSHDPILSSETFEVVQKILKQKSRPRHSRQAHNFPFTGLLSCKERGSAITAQWTKGHGGIYRYYRCTKKKGNCSQGYLQEKQLVTQLHNQLQKVSLPDDWISNMEKQVNEWEKEKIQSSKSFAQNLEQGLTVTEAKLDKLVSAYLDGDIPKENYLKQKEELMKQKLSLETKKANFGRTGKNWIESLRRWLLDLKEAKILAFSENYPEIKSKIQKIGTNPVLFEKTVSLEFLKPFDLATFRKAECVSIQAVPPLAERQPLPHFQSCSCWSARQESNLRPSP
ncbi:recombinase zinc beta ribbon domain-containing protein [Candidatus Giovannonibacteria bacterium]|nr:recombinase zinc beta ribbon domain-containing protein [Candidatus Giovannonibacteria bacterium]